MGVCPFFTCRSVSAGDLLDHLHAWREGTGATDTGRDPNCGGGWGFGLGGGGQGPGVGFGVGVSEGRVEGFGNGVSG
jgi:hypothetical protein